ncbi:TetR/AcrR family transcriptional regulator [Pseudonocardia acaciae]|uniref:TetR/AcrR family transcriptional regulator n=1 Tax=Pseudonocardia acaciae TaxID=551276 RepID=UPI0006842569|nr:TetR/AcrR family transcriptional regulator [Pseudonocardia acaciae]
MSTPAEAATAAIPLTAKGRATRARLLACAREEAIAHGGHLEIAGVARAAGVAPSLVHRYFGSKAGLVGALVNEFFDRFHAEVLDVDLNEEGDWATHERLRLELGVRFHYADAFAVVLYAQLGREAEVARTEAARIATVIEHAATSIRRAQRLGELPAGVDPKLAGAAMFGAIQRVMVEVLGRDPLPPAEQVIDVLWRQVAASVGIDPGHGQK